ncbi:uncharacterized protein G2W53_029352 [Senna tora]|uniref:Transposase MuDR plant domain-containing protein n=1 Tax=Senna tora TaxID=362788 RepID=A0A834T583_9FABA|nr:uncharacterized protein G2W53_029352 [Senna tora]
MESAFFHRLYSASSTGAGKLPSMKTSLSLASKEVLMAKLQRRYPIENHSFPRAQIKNEIMKKFTKILHPQFAVANVIEICAKITAVQQESAGGDYIPEAPLQTILRTEDDDFRSGLVFTDKEAVQNTLKVFSLKRHVDYRVTRFAEKFIECKFLHHVTCCKWRARASYRVGLQLWMISRYDSPHNCASTAIAKDYPKLDSDMIARIIADLVANKANIPISLVVETVKKARGFTISYKKAWWGKQKVVAW